MFNFFFALFVMSVSASSEPLTRSQARPFLNAVGECYKALDEPPYKEDLSSSPQKMAKLGAFRGNMIYIIRPLKPTIACPMPADFSFMYAKPLDQEHVELTVLKYESLSYKPYRYKIKRSHLEKRVSLILKEVTHKCGAGKLFGQAAIPYRLEMESWKIDFAGNEELRRRWRKTEERGIGIRVTNKLENYSEFEVGDESKMENPSWESIVADVLENIYHDFAAIETRYTIQRANNIKSAIKKCAAAMEDVASVVKIDDIRGQHETVLVNGALKRAYSLFIKPIQGQPALSDLIKEATGPSVGAQ